MFAPVLSLSMDEFGKSLVSAGFESEGNHSRVGTLFPIASPALASSAHHCLVPKPRSEFVHFGVTNRLHFQKC
jgi:hypothetical protein